MYVYMYIRIYVYIYIRIYVYIYEYVYIDFGLCMPFFKKCLVYI